MSVIEFVLVGLAAFVGGAVNALAGGGTLITFPTLTAVGIPAVAANVTNTVALCPGYLAGTYAQLGDLGGKSRRLWLLALVGILGGVIGGVLLLNTSEMTFRKLVPYLILLASALLAVQDQLRTFITRRMARAGTGAEHETVAVLSVGLAAVYGGYFGAGLGVILLAVLGLVLDDTLTRLNAIKQIVSFFTNIAAAVFFLLSGKIVWPVVLIMGIGALLGGSLGGRLAGRIQPSLLRWIVITMGIIIAVIYFRAP